MRRSEIIITALVAIPFMTSAFSAIGFSFGFPVQGFYVPLAMVLALGFVLSATRDRKGRTTLVFASVLLASLVLASCQLILPLDDGMVYHYPAISMLAKGWNPLRVSEIVDIQKIAVGARPWHVAFLPRGAWIYGASLYKIFGYLEIADSLNYLGLVIGLLSVNGFLLRFGWMKRWMRYLLSFIIVFTPTVAYYQFDGNFELIRFSLLLAAIYCFDQFVVTKSWRLLPTAGMSIVVMSGIKYTGVSIGVVLFAVYGIYSLVKGGAGKLFVAGCVTGLMILLVNPSPYVTSWINHGGPFYPTHTFDKSEELKEDKITWDFALMNDDAKKLGYWGRLCYAWISQDAVNLVHNALEKRNDFMPEFRQVDVGGYGVVFRFFFVLSLLLWPLVRNRNVNLFACLILLTLLMQPAYFSGYARYVHQIYIFPWLIMIGVADRFVPVRGWLRFLPLVLLAMTGVLLYMPLHRWPTFYMQNVQALGLVESLRGMNAQDVVADVPLMYHQVWLNNLGIAYRNVDEGLTPALKSISRAGIYAQPLAIWTECAMSNWCTDKGLISEWDFVQHSHKGIKGDMSKDYYRSVGRFMRSEALRFPIRIAETLKLRALQICRLAQ